MLAIGKGDLDAFEEIVRRHQRWAWNTASRILGRAEDAEDIVQDAFMRLLDAAPRYRPTASFRTYFHCIVTRLCLDHARKKRPIYPGNVPEVEDSNPLPPASIQTREKRESIRAALNTLPPSQRVAVILKYYEEMSYQDIASAMQVSRKAVERLLARGRASLGRFLGDSLAQ